VVVVAEVEEFLPRELGAVVGDNRVGDAETVDVVWTSPGPLPRWVPGPTTRWAPGTTQLALHGI
jgi:hypothetical protein